MAGVGPSSAGDESTASPQPDGGPGTGWREEYFGGSGEAEERLFQQFERQINQIQASFQAATGSAVVRRGFHAKIHAGTTNAEFRVLDDIPADLRVGPFTPGAVYPATVRFSNASGRLEADGKRDLRGLAFRITTEGGDAQDFLLTNATASHARDAKQFMAVTLFDANPSKLRALPGLVKELGVTETLRIIRVVMKSARRVESLAKEQYWNRAPVAWGKYAVRFDLKPAPEVMREPEPPIDRSGDNYLRDDLHQRLLRGPLTYRFRIQRFVGPGRTPIEDGAAEWREQDAPATTIAELVIPRQDLRSAEAAESEARVEAMEFSPWNSTEAFRPLGNLNRARNLVYLSSADLRAGRKGMADGAQRRPRPAEGGDARQATLGTAFWLVLRGVFGLVNRFVPWHRLPPFIGIFNLGMFREVLRRENQYGTYLPPEAGGPKPDLPPFESRFLNTRISEGFYNELEQPEMGSVGRRFLRNMPLKYAVPDTEPALLQPSPREVSNRLLAREHFVPATSLNLLAAAWIQFQIHDWVGHASDPGKEYEIPLAEADPWETKPMRVRRTAADPTRTPAEAHLPPTFRNRESHWWDGSQIYGSNDAATQRLRAGKDGKLRIDDESFLLPIDPETKLPLTGFTDNWWVGLSLMHTLFAREHNAICDRIRADFADWPDDKVFDTARLVNTALMVKIHNLEWTPAILAHPTLRAAMNAQWWGLQGKTLHRLFGRLSSSEVISGIPGSPTDHRAMSYALTEEFVAVYRHHTMMPDEVAFYSARNGAAIKTLPFEETAFEQAPQAIDDETTMTDAFYSFGIAHPGAITLHNYPNFLRDLHLPGGRHMDLAAVDILRDREHGIPRYNTFRKLMHLGEVRTFEQITSNATWAREMREVYEGDVNRVDPMVGMFAEDLPRGFGFSELAFRVFLVVASQRLKSDRFFTQDYTPQIYTPAGMEWIASNDMTSVLIRHYPGVAPALRQVRNPFAPWRRLGM